MKNVFKDVMMTCLLLFLAFIVCFLITSIDEGTVAVPMIFILTVFLVSRYTSGYAYGIICSLISVLGVNYVFTYPYFEFNFTLSGYPVTILSMLIITIITGTMTTQIKQQESMKLEVEKEKTRSNLLRAVSHDLRTPLTSISGASAAIVENKDKITRDEELKLLNEIREDSQWLIRMVENLLSITKIDNQGDTKIIKQPEMVEEVISETVLKFKNRYEGFMTEVKVPDEVLFVPMDAMLIEQVLMNLLENAAIHSMTVDKIELEVVDEGEFVKFKVKDNGQGIEDIENIFSGTFKQRYEEQGDTKRNQGIGLSVCYTIIKAHGGSLKAKNRPNGGAEFSFTLPMDD